MIYNNLIGNTILIIVSNSLLITILLLTSGKAFPDITILSTFGRSGRRVVRNQSTGTASYHIGHRAAGGHTHSVSHHANAWNALKVFNRPNQTQLIRYQLD